MICFSYIFSKYFMSRFSFAGRAITEVLAVAQRKRGEKSSIGGGKTMGFGREFGKKKTKEKKKKKTFSGVGIGIVMRRLRSRIAVL